MGQKGKKKCRREGVKWGVGAHPPPPHMAELSTPMTFYAGVAGHFDMLHDYLQIFLRLFCVIYIFL